MMSSDESEEAYIVLRLLRAAVFLVDVTVLGWLCWKNWLELGVVVVFIPYLIDTCLLPTEGFDTLPPRLSDFLLAGILAAEGT